MSQAPTNSVANALLGAVAEQTVAVQLKPVRLQITVYFMGSKRIKHANGKYRCKYRLLKEGASAAAITPSARADPGTSELAPLAVIGNVVHGVAATAVGAKPALPAANGGTNANPDPDDIYRIEVVDNHAVPSGDLNAVFGGALSKPGSYTAANWVQDVKPAVPFRIVVRKFVGDTQVALDKDDEIEAIVEVKDPKEEFAQTDGNRRAFLNGFFAKYNRKDLNPTTGDDNALARFAGIREGSAAYPGVKAPEHLRKIEGDVAPKVIEAAPANDSVIFDNLKKPDPLGTARAVFPCKKVKDSLASNMEVGVADFALIAGPTSGDNYRFLISLRAKLKGAAGGKADPRELKLNGVPVQLVDDQNRPIPAKMCYTTGRMVTWRKLHIRLLVTCNGLNAGAIDFNSIRETYRRSFIEVDGPVNTFNITWQVWRDAIRTRYGAGADPWFNDANQVALQAAYANGLIPGTFTADPLFRFTPGGPQYNFDLDPDVHAITRYLINRACDGNAPQLTNPNGNDQVTFARPDSDGMFLLLARRGSPDTTDSTLGEYIGDRIFYMYDSPGNPADTIDTCAHEMGHALYLSHSLTHRKRVVWGPTGNNVNVMEATSNCAINDHDQADAASCLMAYISSSHLTVYPYHPCGACALCLRYYDKREFQQSGGTRYGNQMFSDIAPAQVCWYDIGNGTITPNIPPVNVGGEIDLVVVGKEKLWPKTGGTFPARVGLCGLAGLTSANATKLSLQGNFAVGGVKIQTFDANQAGTVRVTWSHRGVTAFADVTILP
ncbi:MAG: hypothetical protein SFY96_12980 [Planctomycetota bacterium]|nr:hypothetical protein [Planctomycetota bacterium]